MEHIRPYYAKAYYKDLKPFFGGTVYLAHNALTHEIYTAIEAHFATFLPAGFEVVEVFCGAIIIQNY